MLFNDAKPEENWYFEDFSEGLEDLRNIDLNNRSINENKLDLRLFSC